MLGETRNKTGKQPHSKGGAPSIDEQAMRWHCKFLHDQAAGIDGELVLWSKFHNPDTGKERIYTDRFRVGDHKAMASRAIELASRQHTNVWAGLYVVRHGLRGSQRGKEADVIAVIGIVEDLDADRGKAGTIPYEPTFDLITSSVPEINRQSFFIFPKPVDPADAKQIAAGMQTVSDADHCSKDIMHVWRIRGTLNWPDTKKIKGGRPPEPQPVRLSGEVGETVSIETLSEAVDIAMAVHGTDETPDPKPNGHAHTSGFDHPDAPQDIPAWLWEKITSDGGDDRSAACYSVYCDLFQRGYDIEDVVALLGSVPNGVAEKYIARGDLLEDVTRARQGWTPKPTQNTKEAKRDYNGDDSFEPPPASETNDDPEIELRFDGLARWQENQPDDIEFVVNTIIPKGVVTLLVSDGGVGKSMLSQVIGVHVAKGRTLFGLPVHKGKVAGIYCEDPDSILYRRTQNICKAYDIFPDDLVNDVLLESFLDNATELWTDGKPTAIGLALDAYLSRNPEITLLTVDNASEVYGGNENIRQEVRSFMRWLTGLAQKHDLAVLLIAHTSKSQGPEAYQAASGSTAWVNSSRSLLRLQPPTENPRVLHLQHLKANYSKKLPNPIELAFVNGTLVPASHAERDAGELDAIDARVFSAVKSALDADFTISLSDHANNNAWSTLKKRASALVDGLDRKTIDESIERNRQAGMLGIKPNPRTNNPTLTLDVERDI